MSISLQHTPGPVNLLCDQVKLAFLADGRLQSAGAKAQCTFWNVAGVNMPATHWVDIAWNGITERITFAGIGTNGNGCQPLGTTNGSGWCRDHLAEALRANYNISRDFDINAPMGQSVSLTARTQQARNLTVTQRTGYNSGMTFSVNHPGADPVYQPGYAIIVQTYVRTANGVTTLVNEDRLTPDSTGYAEADFGELLRTYVTPVVAVSNNEVVTKRTGMVCTFWFRYGEVWNGDYQRLYITPEYKGIWGGLSQVARSYIDNEMADWYTLMLYDKLFLNNMPPVVYTTPQAPQRLYWMCMHSGLSSVQVWARSWNTGGVNDQLAATITNPEQYMIYEIDTSYQRMVYNGWAAPNDLRYEVTVRTTGGVILAGPQGYRIDRRESRHQRYFLFRNSLGGFDTLIARGLQQTSQQITRYISEYNAQGQRQAWRNEANQMMTQNTGGLQGDYLQYLAELMLSTDVQLIVPGHRTMKVIIADTEMDQQRDDQQRPTLSFTFTPVSKDQFYSRYY